MNFSFYIHLLSFMYCILVKMLWNLCFFYERVYVNFCYRDISDFIFDMFNWRKHTLTYVWVNKQSVNSILPPCFFEIKSNICPICRRCWYKKVSTNVNLKLWKFPTSRTCFFALSELFLSTAIRILCKRKNSISQKTQRANKIVFAGHQFEIPDLNILNSFALWHMNKLWKLSSNISKISLVVWWLKW